MSRPDRHGGGAPAPPVSPLLVLSIFAGVAVVGGVVWLGGTLGAAAAGAGWSPPPFTPATLIRALRGEVPWPGVEAPFIAGGITVVGLAVIAAAVPLALWISGRTRDARGGLAQPRHVKHLTVAAQAKKARRLRPSLAGVPVRRIETAQAGFVIGDLAPDGPTLRGSWEDTALVFMGPRAGKTSSIAGPAVLQAPGACLVTSNKADIYTLTCADRAKQGRVWLFDLQNITYGTQEVYCDLLAWASTLEGATRLAMHLSVSSGDPRGEGWWSKAGRGVLRTLFHAAALDDDCGLDDALAWVADAGDRTPLQILRRHGLDSLARTLAKTIDGASDTREGIYEHARQAVDCLLDPDTLAWVTPAPGLEPFDPARFATSRETIYILSKDGGGSAAGVVAALTDICLRAGVAEAEASPGQRLDAPMTAVLDEAANVCKIADLPDLYSHLGSRGIVPITILQSYLSGVTVWGADAMGKLFGVATIKVIGAGLDEKDFSETISSMVGTHYVTETSVSHGPGGGSTSTSRRRERIMEPADIREMDSSSALLFATSTRPALLRLRPWFASADAERLGQDKQRADEAIVEQARRLRSSR